MCLDYRVNYNALNHQVFFSHSWLDPSYDWCGDYQIKRHLELWDKFGEFGENLSFVTKQWNPIRKMAFFMFHVILVLGTMLDKQLHPEYQLLSLLLINTINTYL